MSTAVPAILLILAGIYLVGTTLNALFQPRPGVHSAAMLRTRPVRTARPEGTAHAPAAGAAPATPWALAPVLYERGASPCPADTRTDLPAIPAVRPYAALAPVRADCPSSPTGGHCCHNDGGTWTCCLPGCPR